MVDKTQKPHHLVLQFRKDDLRFNETDFKFNLYNTELQRGLMKFKEEANKMLVYVTHIFETTGNILFLGGEVRFSKDCNSEAYRIIDSMFSALKSKSVYETYMFDIISTKEQDSMWDSLFSENTEDIRSYTIVYRISSNIIREVTKYEFGTKYNLLVTSELEEEG